MDPMLVLQRAVVKAVDPRASEWVGWHAPCRAAGAATGPDGADLTCTVVLAGFFVQHEAVAIMCNHNLRRWVGRGGGDSSVRACSFLLAPKVPGARRSTGSPKLPARTSARAGISQSEGFLRGVDGYPVPVDKAMEQITVGGDWP